MVVKSGSEKEIPLVSLSNETEVRHCQIAGTSREVAGTAGTGKLVFCTTVKVVGMVKIQRIGTIGSQALRTLLTGACPSV